MSVRIREFEFVADRYTGTRPAIGCDGLVPGASLDLTHWQGNRTPRAFKADTSTEIALNFAASAEFARWADAVVVNNHFDTDGALSAWALLEPEAAAAQRPLLIAAAEAGDFDEWPNLDRGLWLDAAIRALAASADDDAGAYALVLPQLHKLIDELDQRRDLWGDEWDQLQKAVQALKAGQLRAERHGTVGLLVHASGIPEAPGALLARQFLPGSMRYLLAFEQEDHSIHYRYERPRYAWAETVVRPRCPSPDLPALLNALGPAWTDADLPGMTALIRTRAPISIAPDALLDQFAAFDPIPVVLA